MNTPMERELWTSFNTHSDREATEPEAGDWRNPSYEVRILLVGLVCVLPGILAGLLANMFFHITADSGLAATTGAILFAFLGGWMESVE